MSTRKGATLLARLGFAARGIVYCIVGWFAIDAALRGGKAGDNQGAIASLADEPFGEWLLAAMAAGLAGYALWRLTEALFDPEAQDNDAKGAFRRAGHAVSARVKDGQVHMQPSSARVGNALSSAHAPAGSDLLIAVEASDDSLGMWWKDRYTLAEYHERIGQIADCRTAVVQDAGHMLHHDQPAAVAGLIEQFLGT